MPPKLVVPYSPADRRATISSTFVSSWTKRGRDAAWVHVAGELDIATTPELERRLSDPQLQSRLVVLDLRGLTFMDSSGVHAIVDATSKARREGRRLVLLRGPPQVDRMFPETGTACDVEIRDLDLVRPPPLTLLADVDPAC